MAKQSTLFVTTALQNNAPVQILNATGNCGTSLISNAPSNTQLLCTANVNDSIIDALIVTSDDSSARVLTFYYSVDGGTTKYFWFSINIPLNSGATGAIANIDVLASAVVLGLCINQAGKSVLPLPGAGTPVKVYVGSQTTVTSGKGINVFVTVSDF